MPPHTAGLHQHCRLQVQQVERRLADLGTQATTPRLPAQPCHAPSPARTPTPCTGPSAPGRVLRSAAYELDAADGVIDGKFYGRPIVRSPGTPDLQLTLPAFEVTTRHEDLPLQVLLLLLLLRT